MIEGWKKQAAPWVCVSRLAPIPSPNPLNSLSWPVGGAGAKSRGNQYKSKSTPWTHEANICGVNCKALTN